MVQKNLFGENAERTLNKRRVTDHDSKSNYSRFFKGAFAEIDVSELIEQGAGEDFLAFKQLTKNRMDSSYLAGYWEKMFSFTSKRDGRVLESKYAPLGKAIYANYFEGEKPTPKISVSTVTFKRGKLTGQKRRIYRDKRGRFARKKDYFGDFKEINKDESSRVNF